MEVPVPQGAQGSDDPSVKRPSRAADLPAPQLPDGGGGSLLPRLKNKHLEELLGKAAE